MSVVEEKCPNCMAPLRFDPASGKKCCNFCGSVFAIAEEKKPEQKIVPEGASRQSEKEGRKQLKAHPGKPEGREAEIQGFDFASLDERVSCADASELPVYNCVSCGAEIINAAPQFSLRCPYCGNNIILADKISGPLRPDGVIPFRITPEELPAAVDRFYKHKVLLPKNFFSESRMGKVTGIYVPFWVFNGKVSGRQQVYATQIRSHVEGKYEVTESSNYELELDVAMRFQELPVDASSKLDDTMMDTLEPFDLSEVKNFRTDYLQGFAADRFDVEKKDLSERALGRVRRSVHVCVERAIRKNYSQTSAAGGTLQADIDAKYLLFPVYSFQIHFGGEAYNFTVNGQTGKVVGELPKDRKIRLRYFLLRTLLITIGLMAWHIVRYFMGG